MDKIRVKSWDLIGRNYLGVPEAPEPNAIWKLERGTAWVYYASGNKALTKPVIVSDGFHQGETTLQTFWDGLDRGQFAFVSNLRRRGRDVVLLGYNDCTASILDNSRTAEQCIDRACKERQGTAPLAVGGFSMGGIITRHALVKMEMQRRDHETATYFCYDSPHHGAWIPIGVQALAHLLPKIFPDDPEMRKMSDMVNSMAARQHLRYHIAAFDDQVGPGPNPVHVDFFKNLDWPHRPRLLGVANGSGRKTTKMIPPGVPALYGVPGGPLAGFALNTQASGNDKVVFQSGPAFGNLTKLTSGLPEVDGAHGGMLESFGLAYNAMTNPDQPPMLACPFPSGCFVPTASAMAFTDGDIWQNLGADVSGTPVEKTPFEAFKCASVSEKHTLMTEDLGTWIIDRLLE